jgi:hypothetical protein
VFPSHARVITLTIGITLLAAAAPPARAAAQGSTEADLIKQGVEKRRHNEDENALELFRQAYSLGHSPRAAAQMGLAEIALGRWVDAVAHLEEATSATGDAWIQKNARTLQQSLERARQEVGTLEVLGAPANAQLIIGGEVRGTLPLPKPLTVRAGELRFEIRAPGYETEGRTIRVSPGQLTRETVALNAIPAVTEAPRAQAVEPGSPLRVATSSDEAPRSSRAGAGLRNAGLIVAGAGVIAGGVGLVFGLRARSAGQTDSTAPMFNRSADSSGHTYENLQWIGYGTGAALVVGGAVLYGIGAMRGKEPSSTSISFVPLVEGGGLAFVRGSL